MKSHETNNDSPPASDADRVTGAAVIGVCGGFVVCAAAFLLPWGNLAPLLIIVPTMLMCLFGLVAMADCK